MGACPFLSAGAMDSCFPPGSPTWQYTSVSSPGTKQVKVVAFSYLTPHRTTPLPSSKLCKPFFLTLLRSPLLKSVQKFKKYQRDPGW